VNGKQTCGGGISRPGRAMYPGQSEASKDMWDTYKYFEVYRGYFDIKECEQIIGPSS
jgi:hypothetical protein